MQGRGKRDDVTRSSQQRQEAVLGLPQVLFVGGQPVDILKGEGPESREKPGAGRPRIDLNGQGS